MAEVGYLLLSCAIEGPAAFLIVWWMGWPSRGNIHVAIASVVATAVTHPQLWQAALWAYPRFGYWPAIVVLELLVFIAEAGLIAWMAQLPLQRAALVSLGANTASLLVGLWLAV